MSVRRGVILALALALLGFCLPVMSQADTMALQTGGFTWSYYSDTTIGWQFDLSSPVKVTALGFLDRDGNMVDSHPVGIWDAIGTLLASATVQAGDPKTDGFLFRTIAPVVLPAGSGYVAGALPTINDTWGNGATVR